MGDFKFKMATGAKVLNRYSSWNCTKTQFFQCHYLHNWSALNINALVMAVKLNPRNVLLGRFLLVHPVYMIRNLL
jgi:hypothetical protein